MAFVFVVLKRLAKRALKAIFFTSIE